MAHLDLTPAIVSGFISTNLYYVLCVPKLLKPFNKKGSTHGAGVIRYP